MLAQSSRPTAQPASGFTIVRALDDAPMHPLLARLFLYWQSIAPPGRLPGRVHFDPLDIHDLMPSLWMVDVARDPFRLRYRLYGTHGVAALGFDPTGRWLDEVHAGQAEAMRFERSRVVADEGVATWRRGPPLLKRDVKWASLENLYLPLATDGATVDLMLAMTLYFDLEGNLV